MQQLGYHLVQYLVQYLAIAWFEGVGYPFVQQFAVDIQRNKNCELEIIKKDKKASSVIVIYLP